MRKRDYPADQTRLHTSSGRAGSLRQLWRGIAFALGSRSLLRIFLVCFSLGGVARAATPPNTEITNTATIQYLVAGSAVSISAWSKVRTAARTPATIELLNPAPSGTSGSNATSLAVQATQCAGKTYATPQFSTTKQNSPTLPAAMQLQKSTEFRRGDAIFIQVTDYDQNTDATVANTIVVVVKNDVNDTEELTLTETGPSTGVFAGYIQTKVGSSVNGDCVLGSNANQKISVAYTDPADKVSTVSSDAMVDPFGYVFDSVTAKRIDGAIVRMVNNATNQTATVYCDDGVTVLPQPVVTGQATICDANITTGGYRFPLAVVGSYRIEVKTPVGYAFPSTVGSASILAQFRVLGTSPAGPSYGGAFNLVLGPPLHIDIPVDSSVGELEISKTASLSQVSEGDFLLYTLDVKNLMGRNLSPVEIEDRLPVGFRYQKGSAKLDGVALEQVSVSADARTIRFTIPKLLARASSKLSYVTTVSVEAKAGQAENTAYAVGSYRSNTARAVVNVREELMRSKALLLGNVWVGDCDGDAKERKGLAKARIVLEDGKYLITDQLGQWHADHISAGTHVVQLDTDSLPADYEVLACEKNTRFAGRATSQFVEIKAGALWRADFYVRPKANAGSANIVINTQGQGAGSATATATTSATTSATATAATSNSANPATTNLDLVEKLPFDEKWLASASPGLEWLHPLESFSPALPAIKLAVKHLPGHSVTIRVNGAAVSGYSYNGMVANAQNSVALSTWSGVPIRDGQNQLQIEVSDAAGTVVSQQTRSIYFASGPSKATLVKSQSVLVADGKTPAVIAVQLWDANNKPARRGMVGEFQLNSPYQALAQTQALEAQPTSGNIQNNKARYEIGDDGIAYIRLAPSTQSGEAVLSFDLMQHNAEFGDKLAKSANHQEVRAWLEAKQRDWILVGFAKGTRGNQSISGNVDAALAAGADATLWDQDQIAFYAKGTIQGDTLLTIAYDSAKKRSDKDLNQLKQEVKPDAYYTLYADGSQQGLDAASSGKLYVKMERKQFYALFGDFDTGLSLTEFSSYNRSFYGAKTEYSGERVKVQAFASKTAQAYRKDEIRGNGTSGTYPLSRGNIMQNSDKLRLEVRERLHTENILKTTNLTRFIDYDIDYDKGTLFFRAPVAVEDAQQNPVYIVAEYESRDTQDESITAGARIALKPIEQLTLGATYVREGTQGNQAKLMGLDVSAQLTPNTRLVTEYAKTEKQNLADTKNGTAKKIEVLHSENGLNLKAYAREQSEGFGLGQQSSSEAGSRKLGFEAQYQINESNQVQAQVYRIDASANQSTRLVEELRVNQKPAPEAQLSYGVRKISERRLGQAELKTTLATLGASYALIENRLFLRAAAEKNLADLRQASDPDRYSVGADYKLNEQTSLFAEHLIEKTASNQLQRSHVGLRVQPWTGAEMASKVGQEQNADGPRLFTDIGLSQKWQINSALAADVNLHRTHYVASSEARPTNSAQSANPNADATAISVGLNYQAGDWSANARLEKRSTNLENARNLLLGVQRQLSEGQSVAASVSQKVTSTDTSRSQLSDARLSYVYRPIESNLTVLSRLDYKDQKNTSASDSLHEQKYIIQTHVNWKPLTTSQISALYAIKHVRTTIAADAYTSNTDLVALEARQDITERWDVAVQLSQLRSINSGIRQYSAGASLGFKAMENTWLNVGYNLQGFNDQDFSGAAYRNKGAYLRLNIKFDQDTFTPDSKPE